MSNKLYVANIPFSAGERDLEELFAEYGAVSSVRLIYGEGERHRGFGFIEMATHEDAELAIKELNGAEFMSRPLVVNEAKEREPRRSNSGGSGYGRDRDDRSSSFRRRDFSERRSSSRY